MKKKLLCPQTVNVQAMTMEFADRVDNYLLGTLWQDLAAEDDEAELKVEREGDGSRSAEKSMSDEDVQMDDLSVERQRERKEKDDQNHYEEGRTKEDSVEGWGEWTYDNRHRLILLQSLLDLAKSRRLVRKSVQY